MRMRATTTSARTPFQPTPVWPAQAGRLFFSIAILGTGLQHLVARDFVTRMFPEVPAWLPARPLLACAFGALLVLIGLALAFQKKVRAAALLLAALFFLSLLFLHVPRIAANPGMGGVWTNPMKVVVFLGTALFLAALASGEPRSTGASESPAASPRVARADLLARVLFSGFLVLCGVQHFVYLDFVATLVPAWIPGPVFWAEFAGVALIAGGVGLLLKTTERAAALLTALMIFSWFLVLHIPRALAAPGEPMEWAGVCESLAMSGVALLLAGTGARGKRGLA